MISDTNAGFYGFYGARGVHKRGGFLFFYEAGSANNKPGQKAVMTSFGGVGGWGAQSVEHISVFLNC